MILHPEAILRRRVDDPLPFQLGQSLKDFNQPVWSLADQIFDIPSKRRRRKKRNRKYDDMLFFFIVFVFSHHHQICVTSSKKSLALPAIKKNILFPEKDHWLFRSIKKQLLLLYLLLLRQE
jgi:hypothetical protein